MENGILNDMAKEAGKTSEYMRQTIEDMIDNAYSTSDFNSYDIIPHKGDRPTVEEFLDFWVNFFAELSKSRKLHK